MKLIRGKFFNTNILIHTIIYYSYAITLMILFKAVTLEQCIFSLFQLMILFFSVGFIYWGYYKFVNIVSILVKKIKKISGSITKTSLINKSFKILSNSDIMLFSMILFSFGSYSLLYIKVLNSDQYILLQGIIVIIYLCVYLLNWYVKYINRGKNQTSESIIMEAYLKQRETN